ncbi:VpaChn25_0724 family phage protein [Pseudomonas peli]|uniref:VpaChn25_0724 family phage protein n=1 Tax=Pseudomonas peli TaxID=592361 RepID=UPI0028582B1A|nr:ArsR family transcriptional regulator [Pseudomonas peli]MDR7024378.1 Fe2+ or Zn2+ uptake regulation protein [Pseudomonas peli]
MSKYANYLSEDRRLVILRILAEMPTYRANSSVLHTVLNEWGHEPSRDQVKTELRWLEEQQLVALDDVGDGAVLLAKLTERGADVAAGRARVDGVKRPGA